MPSRNRSAIGMVLAGVLAAAVCATTAVAAADGEFRFRREIDCGKLERQGPVAVALDSDVYAATRDGFPDLGVFDAQGRRVPCLVEKDTQRCARLVREPCPIEVIPRPERTERIRLIVVLGADAPAAEGLSVFTPQKNYECLVRVLGSVDAKYWRPLVEDGFVFDYSGYLDLRNRDIRLPANKCRHFVIDVVARGQGDESLFAELMRRYSGRAEERPRLPRRPFQLDHIELWHERTQTRPGCDVTAGYSVTLFRVQNDLASRLTLLYVHSRREPLTELTLEAPAGNFTRAVRVEMPAAGIDQWIDVARGRVTQLDFAGYHRRDLGIPLPEQRADDYRLVIDNGDNPPLGITDVHGRGNVYRAVFLAAPGETYRLEYGSPTAEPLKDAAAVRAALGQSKKPPIEGRLGSEALNPAAAPPASAWHDLWQGALPLLPWAGAALGSILLLLVAWFLLRPRRPASRYGGRRRPRRR